MKSKAKKKTKAKKITAAPAFVFKPFKAGQRVQVLHGDYGNARGTVHSAGAKASFVLLDNGAHTAPPLIDNDNLRAL